MMRIQQTRLRIKTPRTGVDSGTFDMFSVLMGVRDDKRIIVAVDEGE